MSIEQHLAELTAAVKANTEAVLASRVATTGTAAAESKPAAEAGEPAAKPAATRSRTAAKTAAKPAAPAAAASKYTRDEMNAVLNDLRENDGNPTRAKEVIANAGFDKMRDISDDKIDSVYEAVKAIFAADEAAIDGDDDI